VQNPTFLLDVFVERAEIYLPAIDEGGHLQTRSRNHQCPANCDIISAGHAKLLEKARVSEIQDLLGAFRPIRMDHTVSQVVKTHKQEFPTSLQTTEQKSLAQEGYLQGVAEGWTSAGTGRPRVL
jgi:hypothetical protein